MAADIEVVALMIDGTSESTDHLVSFKDGGTNTGLAKFVGGGQTRRACPDNQDLLVGRVWQVRVLWLVQIVVHGGHGDSELDSVKIGRDRQVTEKCNEPPEAETEDKAVEESHNTSRRRDSVTYEILGKKRQCGPNSRTSLQKENGCRTKDNKSAPDANADSKSLGIELGKCLQQQPFGTCAYFSGYTIWIGKVSYLSLDT